jgi:hypothetical protein
VIPKSGHRFSEKITHKQKASRCPAKVESTPARQLFCVEQTGYPLPVRGGLWNTDVLARIEARAGQSETLKHHRHSATGAGGS